MDTTRIFEVTVTVPLEPLLLDEKFLFTNEAEIHNFMDWVGEKGWKARVSTTASVSAKSAIYICDMLAKGCV